MPGAPARGFRFALLTLVCLLYLTFTEEARPDPGSDRITVAFWNVYNLFDTVDDPLKQDEEFTPTGKFHWTEERLSTRIEALASILTELDADIVGLAEVENMTVLKRLGQAAGYRYAYLIEREDARGIDVGILSRKELSNVRNSGPGRGYIVGSYRGTDFAFTHWKSKLGSRTQARRLSNAAHAKTLKPPYILLGDFNEEPSEPARQSLGSIGLMDLIERTACASFLEKSKWICIDGAYMKPGKCRMNAQARIVRLPAMMVGKKPDPAYSDHFPVLAETNTCDQGND
ncbi:MAG: endonuclease/exonuclease/phosphatase family protein [Leptospirales bacterium]|nr:endonuclease/exonuclease/phosphatase family protein [Leptospirales bacterium]